ncbi:MAG: CpsD/CapB family tyrosine-protein kinase, partial [Bacilli bacterium]
ESNGKLYLLTTGTTIPNPQEMLGSEKFKELILKLRERFDFIVIDCPPISAVADAIPIAKVSDGTVFVISAKDTNKNDARTALTQLQRNGVNILGSVLTKVDVGTNNYNYYYTNDK